jgi:hypothetical protein
MKTIKYIGFYSKDINDFVRNGSIAAANKMDYICSAINRLGYKVNVVSPSWFRDDVRKYAKSYQIKVNQMKSITFAPSFIANNRLTRFFRARVAQIWLFKYLLMNSNKDEDIIIYHSLALIKPVLLAKRFKKFNLILETNEIYCDVKKYSKNIKKLENKMIKLADKYIFSTELLNEKINVKSEPYVVNYGTYFCEKPRGCKFNDDKIHIVYAGIIDAQKGGATTAAKAAVYLNNNYHIHIIGFGDKKSIKELEDLINAISKEAECLVSYDGLLQGEEYIEFIQRCDIGLSTQTPIGAYNETSFPSKVLSYLANGLRVVSIKIKAIEQSKVGQLIYFYDKDISEELANTIKRIDLTEAYNSRENIDELHNLFISDLGKLFCDTSLN